MLSDFLKYVEDIEDAQYFAEAGYTAGKWLNNSTLKKFSQEGFLKGKYLLDNQEQKEPGEAMMLGTVTHHRLLEDDATFGSKFSVSSALNKDEKPYGWETKAQAKHRVEILREEGRTAITQEMFDKSQAMRNAVLANDDARILLSNGWGEKVIRCKNVDMDCQIKIDWFNPDFGIVDLKTTREIKWFKSAANKLGYFYGGAFYRDCLFKATGLKCPYYIIAVDTFGPHESRVIEIDEDTLDEATRENTDMMVELQKCIKTGVWPSRYNGFETMGFDRDISVEEITVTGEEIND